jgi:hypothetical protein
MIRISLRATLIPLAILSVVLGACQPMAPQASGEPSTISSMEAPTPGETPAGSPVAPAEQSDHPEAESPLPSVSEPPPNDPYVAPDAATDPPGAEETLPAP